MNVSELIAGPMGILLVGGALGAVALVLALPSRFYVGGLALVLLGYILGNKGFAYLGYPPLFISEIMLGLGVLFVAKRAVTRGGLPIVALRHPGSWLLLLLMGWGALRTLPYLGEYKLDAVRDAVIWLYGFFALALAILLPPTQLDRVFGWYRRVVLWVPFVLLAVVLLRRFVDLPMWPGTAVPIILVKSGDAGVHLAGVAAFVLLRLDRVHGPRFAKLHLWFFWLTWGATWMVYGSNNRGGMVSAVLGVVVVMALRPKRQEWLRPALLVVLLLFGLLAAEVAGVQLSPEGSRRTISLDQIVSNVQSLFGKAEGDEANTVSWRLSWWSQIVDYTFGGDYFWGGKGFGINLAEADGFRGRARDDGATNRHPHNYTMNILARAGVVGLVLWLALVVYTGLRLLGGATARGPDSVQMTWLLAYWTAFLFNAQVDVFFEGPMGGVWFWSLTGIIWVALARRRVLARQALGRPVDPGVGPALPRPEHVPV